MGSKIAFRTDKCIERQRVQPVFARVIIHVLLVLYRIFPLLDLFAEGGKQNDPHDRQRQYDTQYFGKCASDHRLFLSHSPPFSRSAKTP